MNTVISLLFILFSFLSFGQSVEGVWKTVDDVDGKAKSHIKIYMEEGKIVGKIIKLIDPEGTTCTACKGDRKDQPIEGMTILWGLKRGTDKKWKSGKILDPQNGKQYKCKIELVEDNSLEVRGFIGFSLLGRTQTWYRVE